MGFFENILKSLFGSKSEREMKKLDGTIARIKAIGADRETRLAKRRARR